MWEEMVRKSWENGWSESRGKTDGQKVVGRDGQKVVGRDGQLCAESRGISPDFQNE